MTRGRDASKDYRANRQGIVGVRDTEIEPGRAVVNDWNSWVVERWVDRKARRLAERAA